jgi:hypothetical protein
MILLNNMILSSCLKLFDNKILDILIFLFDINKQLFQTKKDITVQFKLINSIIINKFKLHGLYIASSYLFNQ